MMWALLIAAGVLLIVTVVSVVDAVGSPRDAVKLLPRWAWVSVIVVLPVIGAALWWTMGRPWRPGSRRAPVPTPSGPPSAAHQGASAQVAPDRFLRGLSAEERIRRLEEELTRLDAEAERDRHRQEPGDDAR